MAVHSVLSSVKVKNVLNNGTKDGKVKTVSVSLGKLNTATYDDQKAINICSLLESCFSKSVLEIRKTEESVLTAD